MRVAVAGGTGVVGRYAVEAASARGHEVVTLSRRAGVDVRDSRALREALAGCDVVIDALNSPALTRRKATSFFVESTRQLQEAGRAAGVGHLVTLSIVGIDRVPGYGYYQAKLAQEEAAQGGPLPVTILRATQFHEFPAQVLSLARKGPVALVPRMQSQPVAARTVGAHLVDAAEARPGGTIELAGPEVVDLPALARKWLAFRGARAVVVPVVLPGTRPMRAGALLATDVTTIDGPTYDEWLATADAARMAG